MSEELRTEELLTNEGHTETMADYEDHFDDAKWRCHCHGRRTARIYSGIQTLPFLH